MLEGSAFLVLLLALLFVLLLDGSAHARSILITWHDNSENEEGFLVERSDDCIDGWDVVAYSGKNQNSLLDVPIPGACYRVAAFNKHGISGYQYSNPVPYDAKFPDRIRR